MEEEKKTRSGEPTRKPFTKCCEARWNYATFTRSFCVRLGLQHGMLFKAKLGYILKTYRIVLIPRPPGVSRYLDCPTTAGDSTPGTHQVLARLGMKISQTTRS